MSLLQLSKHRNTALLSELFKDIKQTLQKHYFIYTDGSKNENAIGYSVTTENSDIETENL